MSKRIFYCGVVVLSLFLLLTGRMGYLVLARGDSLAIRGAEQQLRSIDLYQYSRGDFLDRYGRSLTGQESSCLVAFPTLLGDVEATAEVLSPILNEGKEKLAERLSGRDSLILKTNLSSEEISALKKIELPGIFLIPMYPRYAAPAIACHLIGFVGAASEEEIAANNWDSNAYCGKSGLEKQYDSLIRDRISPKAAVLVDEKGRQAIDELRLLEGEQIQDPSHNVVLTLDMDIQQIAEEAMGEEEGAIVVMEAASGDVLALVSQPTFDPTVGQVDATGDAYLNKAFYGYPPASIFKIVLAAAAIESGIMPEHFVCDGSYPLSNGHIVGCWKEDGHGEEDMALALANSCNPYFTELGLSLGGDAILAYAKKFGLAEPILLGYQLPETWPSLDFNTKVLGDVANVSIGEKGVRLSPLQVAQLLAVVANGGKQVTPRIVKEIQNQQGQTVEVVQPVEPVVAIQPETASLLREYLTGVVESGTGWRAASTIVPTAGKTGTSQYQGVWFAGMAPADEPQWVISIYLPKREAGGKEGAEIFKTIVDKVAILSGM